MRFSDRALWALAVAASLALLMAPAIWNGFPLLQWDTGGYLARWYEGTLVPSRAVVYGLILTAGVPFSFWPVLLLQSGLTVWITTLMLRAHGLGNRPMLLTGIIAALSVGTTLSWLTSILLTDIFCGLSVMALYLLLMRAEVLLHWERIGLIVLVAVAAATHSATLAVLMALQAAAMLLWLVRRDRIPARRLGDGIFALALGALMVFSADYAVAKRLAWTPGGFALSFGRMLQDGIVNKYLDEHCPDPRLKLCAYKDELPRDADKWFWGSPLFNKLGRFEGLGDEMQTIATRALIEYPRLQFETALIATGRQLIDVHTGEGVVAWVMHSYGIIDRFAPQLVPAMHAARQQKYELSFKTINDIHYPLALLCMASLPVLLLLAWRGVVAAEIGELAAVCMLALLANAFICGALSDPHDRYGARMVWLAGFTVALAAAYSVERRRQPQPQAIPSAEPALS
jgi:hypothetical protein